MVMAFGLRAARGSRQLPELEFDVEKNTHSLKPKDMKSE
jgi:hypothetical protein